MVGLCKLVDSCDIAVTISKAVRFLDYRGVKIWYSFSKSSLCRSYSFVANHVHVAGFPFLKYINTLKIYNFEGWGGVTNSCKISYLDILRQFHVYTLN